MKFKRAILEWLGTIALAVVLTLFFRTFIAEARWVPSGSMIPTLKVGDRLMVEKVSNEVNRGDIIVFSPVEGSGLKDDLVKRVIGLPGETIEIKDGRVYIDGTPLEEDYLNEGMNSDFKPTRVPPDSYFVMGDNRNSSFDSRYWGAVPKENIIGKALFLYYPLSDVKMLTGEGSG